MKTVIGAAIGSCVHVGGLHHFLKLAEAEGYKTQSLGPAVSLLRILRVISEEKPDILALSYRLTPESAAELFYELKSELEKTGSEKPRIIFGGTPPAAAEAVKSGIFERVFDGTEPEESIKQYLRGGSGKKEADSWPGTLIERISQKYPYPLIRHHFGRPSLEETLKGVKQISDAGVLDVLSIGPDQNAQEHFFNPADRKSVV